MRLGIAVVALSAKAFSRIVAGHLKISGDDRR
jgi:hypothetical protein